MSLQAIRDVRADCQTALAGQDSELAPLMGDTILVTGGTGFVGTWLAETLACLNDDFGFKLKVALLSRSVDRFKVVYPHLGNRPDFRLIRADVRNIYDLPSETNWLVHAASTPDSRFHSTNPVETMTVIADGTVAVIRGLDRCSNFKKFLQISSGLVNGAQPLNLERMPEVFAGSSAFGTVSSAYVEAKRFAETYCAAARSQQRLPIVTARPFAFIGPYQSLETPWAINNFIRDALLGNDIRVLGDGQTVRSYMYGSDMAVWLLKILTSGTPGASYNVGNPEGITLERVARLISERFIPNPGVRLHTSESNANQRSILVPDVTLAMKTLRVSITTPLEPAIDKTIRWNRACSGLPKTAE
ncbi:MAG: NAD-dependent epimerase/dehydratase family protein [Candidatus Wallbacteria bacterium]|nr:NAD-dependent epimerase/dehydratase family protein [Candidatus Wallbacteria bacterium]